VTFMSLQVCHAYSSAFSSPGRNCTCHRRCIRPQCCSYNTGPTCTSAWKGRPTYGPSVGREALESSYPAFQTGATPSQLPTQRKRPGVLDDPWPLRLARMLQDVIRPDLGPVPGNCQYWQDAGRASLNNRNKATGRTFCYSRFVDPSGHFARTFTRRRCLVESSRKFSIFFRDYAPAG
jgi:hypothetical protein